MEGPSEGGDEVVYTAFCPSCDFESEHDILRSKEVGKGVDHLVKCNECLQVRTIQLRPPKSFSVKFTLSHMDSSDHVTMEIDEDELFELDDEFEYDDCVWKVTRLEMPDASSSKRATAQAVQMVWATRVDVVTLRLTFTDGEYSSSDTLLCDPGKQFQCGSILEHRGQRWRIRALHSGQGRTLHGKMYAHEIRRIFLHRPPTREDQVETKLKIRGRWKGQNFSGREEHNLRVKEENINMKRKYRPHEKR